MKKYLITSILFLFIAASLYSRPRIEHYNNWVFGSGAGITFTTVDGNPKTLEIDDVYNSLEGFSSVSDDNGELLYYIFPNPGSNGGHGNGAKIKDHLTNVIPNGNYIKTNTNVASSALFINDFTNPDLYYVIIPTEPKWAGIGYNDGMQYVIIDKSKGSTGEVVQRTKQLYPNSTEKIVGVMNEVDNICWVITHEWNTDAFKLIKIDENGLDPNVKTINIGMNHISEGIEAASGRMAASPTGTTIAVTLAYFDESDSLNRPVGNVEIYDFEPRKGNITNVRSLEMNEDSYSLAFSPNGEVLYVRSENRIIQYDLSHCDIEETIRTRYIIETSKSVFSNAIERGPNGIIYCVRDYSNKLDAILNPDIIGASCNYMENVLDVGGYCRSGLPTVISSYFTGEYDKCSMATVEREYEINIPEYACYGADFDINIKSDYEQSFELKLERILPFPEDLGTHNSIDSSITIESSNEYGASVGIAFYRAFIITESGERDTLSFEINNVYCCGNTSNNGQFSSISIGKDCKPIQFSTDLEFHSSEKAGCQLVFTSSGQIATSGKPQWHNENFDRAPKVPPYFLIGDPKPNVEQRAWYQYAATQIGEKYTFTAHITNLEKIVRDGDSDSKELSMWLAVKTNGVATTLRRIDDIKYEDGWVEISDEFLATDYHAELEIWVLGTCPSPYGNCTSFGFGIDDISLILSEDPEIVLHPETTLCLGEQLQLINSFSGEISNIEWTPTTGLSNPYILNPVASPTETTEYTISITDKYSCQYSNSFNINIDTCWRKCIPCVSIYMEDDSVDLGQQFCVDGEFVPTCQDDESIVDFSLYFEYNSELMELISASTDYQLIDRNDINIVKLNFEDSSVLKNEKNPFSVCFVALLGDTNVAELRVYTDEETEKEICMNDISKTTINYESCTFPFRRIVFTSVTSFLSEVNQDRIIIKLSTEEQGNFRFVLLDATGRIIKQESYSTNKDKYENEEVTYFDLSEISSGVYFVRMQTPGGKITTQKILVTK